MLRPLLPPPVPLLPLLLSLLLLLKFRKQLREPKEEAAKDHGSFAGKTRRQLCCVRRRCSGWCRVPLCFFSCYFSVVAALFGVFCLYSFVHIKLHPEDPRYITEEQLTRWGQLVHSDANTVSQLQKASVPVLVDLKKRAAWHYEQVSSISFWSRYFIQR